jgi:acyl-CoA thioester hydrolase
MSRADSAATVNAITQQAPFDLPELDLLAPLDRHRMVVPPEWVDLNGHMNVGHYVVAFDHATGTLCDQFGLGWDYTLTGVGTTFVIEAHVTYDREVGGGDPLRITTQIIDYDQKRLHFMHTMYHAERGFLAATNEVMLMNIDLATRRSAPWPEWSRQRIEEMANVHAKLPRPNQVGRIIGIRRRPEVGSGS